MKEVQVEVEGGGVGKWKWSWWRWRGVYRAFVFTCDAVIISSGKPVIIVRRDLWLFVVRRVFLHCASFRINAELRRNVITADSSRDDGEKAERVKKRNGKVKEKVKM